MDKQFSAAIVQEMGFYSHTGQVRDLNEDYVDVGHILRPDQDPIGIYVLADGMGGHEQGEIASRVAVHNVVLKLKQECSLAPEEIPDYCGDWLNEAFVQANASLKERNRERSSNMGTTLLAAVVEGCEAHIASVGDSRAYLLMPNGIQQITTDHTMTQTLLDSGAIQPEEAVNHPYENVLTRAVGLEKELDVDVFTVEIMPGDALLLCSDGLYKQLDDETIQQIVQNSDSAQDACEALVDAANETGGRDNIAVVLVRIKDEDPF